MTSILMEETIMEHFYITLEETRRKLQPLLSLLHGDSKQDKIRKDLPVVTIPWVEEQFYEAIDSIHHSVQRLTEFLPQLQAENLHHGKNNDTEITVMILENCISKGQALALDVWTATLQHYGGATELDQSCIAHCLELTLRILSICPSVQASSTIQIKDDDSLTVQPNFRSNDRFLNEQQGHVQRIQQVTEQYVAYQRKVLRARSKPSISQLASLRRDATDANISMGEYLRQKHLGIVSSLDPKQYHPLHIQEGMFSSRNDPKEERGGGDTSVPQQPYAHTITVILGEGSRLIHPLVLWMQGLQQSIRHDTVQTTTSPVPLVDGILSSILLQMCSEAIQTLHREVQTLAITVGQWFLMDYGYIPDPSFSTSSKKRKIWYEEALEASYNLGHLDITLDEMAFICQVLSRYDLFWNQTWLSIDSIELEKMDPRDKKEEMEGGGELNSHLQEQCLHYSTTETMLSKRKVLRAFDVATPVEIVMGKMLFVPSVVEDSYYISTRAIERASGTMCDRALWVVVHWVCELWSVRNDFSWNEEEVRSKDMDIQDMGICESLMKRKGCRAEDFAAWDKKQNGKETSESSNKKSGDFASALLDALDSEADSSNSSYHALAGKDRVAKAPLSGSFVDLLHRELDAHFCTMNGISSASMACQGLVNLFDSLLDHVDGDNTTSKQSKHGSMMQMAKEELILHSQSYMKLLEDYLRDMLCEYLGIVTETHSRPPLVAGLPSSPALHQLFYNFSQENYNLDLTSFQEAESLERLDNLFVSPIRDSRFINGVMTGKCDEKVTLLIGKEISYQLGEIIVGTIVHQQKKFNEWGSLLLSKQVRVLERFCCDLVCQENNQYSEASVGGTSLILRQFRKLSQALAILQLEKPSDWIAFSYEKMDGRNEENLTKDQVRRIMGLRVDFSEDAVSKVCGSL